MTHPKKAVILLSGGLDSATCLAIAYSKGYQCFALSFAYGQRHHAELNAARKIAEHFHVAEHRIVDINIDQFGGSALTDATIEVPDYANHQTIPITYVPARNTIFLSIALSYAETLMADAIFIGANSVDYSGYPDCRPAFIDAFQNLANTATKKSVEGSQITIEAPLMFMNKAQIIQQGIALGVNYGHTVSCYQLTTDGLACNRCDSCALRRQGFEAAGLPDPTQYFI